jgi:hypothetical protein
VESFLVETGSQKKQENQEGKRDTYARGEDPAIPVKTQRDALAGWETDVDLLVLLYPPPADLLRSLATDPSTKPALAVACGDFTTVMQPLEKGLISAALAQRPDARTHRRGQLIDPPSNPISAFNLCYEVVTPENLDAYLERSPALARR